MGRMRPWGPTLTRPAESRLIGVNPMPCLTTPEPSDARRSKLEIHVGRVPSRGVPWIYQQPYYTHSLLSDFSISAFSFSVRSHGP